MIYTGGTTGMPKGVVAKVGPPLADLLETVPPLAGHAPVAVDDVPAFTAALEGTAELMVSLPAPPLMHNTGLGIGATPALATGGTIVLLDRPPVRRRRAVGHRRAPSGSTPITVVGDAFARPMLAALDADARPRPAAACALISSSGAMFSNEVKAGLLEHLPGR